MFLRCLRTCSRWRHPSTRSPRKLFGLKHQQPDNNNDGNNNAATATVSSIITNTVYNNNNKITTSLSTELHLSRVQLLVQLITGRICRRQLCRYCFYSRPIFGFFRPAGATRCTDQGEIWQGGADRRFAPPAKFHLDRFRGGGLRPPKLKKLEFYQYNCP